MYASTTDNTPAEKSMTIKLFEDVGTGFDFGIAVDFLFSEPA